MSGLGKSIERAAALLIVFVAAKLLVVGLRLFDGGGRGLLSPLAPIALVYQDVATALLIGAVDAGLSSISKMTARRPVAAVVMVVLYVLVALWAACNVPVARVFSTPLTWSMLGTAGGALSDSIARYLTFSNVCAVGAVLGVAALAPRWVRWLGVRWALLPRVSEREGVDGNRAARSVTPSPWVVRVSLAGAATLVALGPSAARRIETAGLHRNAVMIFAVTAFAGGTRPARRAEAGQALAELGRALELSHFSGAAAGRNVIWVILESTAAQYLKPWGAERDPTPRLTELAGRALLFEHAYAAYPESIKGLFATLCSRYPAANTEAGDYVAARLCESVAARLAAAGYRTALFHSGRFRYLGMAGILENRGFHELHDAESIGGRFRASFGTDDASTVRRLLAFVDGLPREQRFLAVYMPISGHHPYKAPGDGPRPFEEKTEFDRYSNDLFSGDAALGELVDGMRVRGLEERTLWVVMADHGEAFLQHEGNFAHTLFLYEENLRVPLLFAAPGVTLNTLRAPQLASVIDVAPTVLSLLGLGTSERWQGRSLLQTRPGVARFYTDHGPLKLGLRNGSWKLIHETEHERTRLFDLSVDPEERNDLAAAQPELVARYRDHLRAWSEAERARLFAER